MTNDRTNPKPPARRRRPAAPQHDDTGRILLETMSQGVVFRDAGGRITSMNPAAERIFGRPLKDLLGRTSAEIHPDAVDAEGRLLAPDAFPAEVALRTAAPVRGFLMGILDPGGRSRRWISVDAMPVLHPGDERPAMVYILFEDITERRRMTDELQQARDHLEQEVRDRTRELTEANETLTVQIEVRKRAEEAFRRSEEKFRRLADSAQDLIYIYRLLPDHGFEYVSPSATAMTGYTPEEHYGNPDLGRELIHADDRHLLDKLAAGEVDPGAPLTLRWVRKDGRILWTEQRNIPVRDASGRIVALQGIARDITDRVRTEERLRENERFLKTIIETEPECVKMIAADGTLLMMNRAGLAMIDAGSLEQVKGQSIYGLIDPPYRQDFIRLTEAAFRGDSGMLAFSATGLKGRPIWLETHCVPLKDEQGTIIAALGITRDITNRKRTEEKLRENEKFLQTIIDTEPECVKMLSRDGAILMMNRAGLEMVQAGSLAEVKDRPALPLIAPEHRRAFNELLLCVFQGRSGALSFEMIGLKGRRLWMDTHMVPLKDESGKIIAALGITRDVTERRKAEDAVRESERRYRQLLESITSYLYTVTVEHGRAVSTAHGSACLAVTGYRSEEFAADPYLWYQMVHDDDKSAVLAQASLVLAGGRPEPLEHRLRHKSGRIVWVRSTLVPRHDAQGRFIAYDGVIEDITERKRSEAFVKNILETVDEGFVVVDRDLTIITANRAFLAQTGMELAQVIGRKCYEVSHHLADPCYKHGVDCPVRTALETGEAKTAIHSHHDRTGKPVTIETKAFPLRGDSGEIVAAIEIIRDISERRTLEEQLRHAQKMEAIGLLAGGIAHDFNNILTAIVGYGNLLKMKTPADDARVAYIDQILASTGRAASLTQSLLAFSRKQSINPQPMGMNDLVRRFEKLLRRVIGEDIEVNISLGPGELTVHADSSQLEQVLMNLVTNAREAMPRGGRLSLTTELADLGEEFRSAHGFGVPGSYVCVTVEDSGAGMDRATLDHVFEPFFTTKELGRGAGLGLAMVYGIMKQHKGYITMESTPGTGTRCRLYFPLTAPAPEQHAAPADEVLPEGHETILVAEDDAQLRELTSTMLTEFGYTVIGAADGDEAVRKFREHAGEIKLAVLDVVMPRMSGRQVRDEIQRADPGVKILFLSGYPEDILQEKGVGGEQFILKPVSPRDFLGAVRRALDSGNGKD